MTADHTPDRPRYYRVHTETENSDTLDEVVDNEDGYPRALTDLEVDPYDPGDSDSWAEEDAARASEEERQLWNSAYATFTGAVERAEETLETARAAWEQAQGVYRGALEDAWQEYAPADTAIGERVEEVRRMRREREEEQRQAEARAAQEAQDAEDRELGPRTWVTYHPQVREVKVAPDMMVPVIHLAGCPVTKGRENVESSRVYANYRYARKDAVQATLLEGAPRYARGRATEERLPTKLCGRCKPQESLRQALGTVFEDWQEERDNERPPMPSIKGMPSALKLNDEWGHYRTPGYRVMSDKYYRDEDLIRADEVLIGWYDPAKETIVANEEALERLMQILPDRGFNVRRVNEPQRYGMGDRLSHYGVAVSRMTAAERRRHQEGAAPVAAGNVVDLEGGDD